MESVSKERYSQTRNSIYQYIYQSSGLCTRQLLAQELKLSLPTIYNHLSKLVDDGLVAYSGEQQSTGGAGHPVLRSYRMPALPLVLLLQKTVFVLLLRTCVSMNWLIIAFAANFSRRFLIMADSWPAKLSPFWMGTGWTGRRCLGSGSACRESFLWKTGRSFQRQRSICAT